MLSTSCCWEGKGSVRTISVGSLFKNLLISSWRVHSFVKWSPPHNRQGYLALLFPLLSFSGDVVLGFSCWFSGFLFFHFPFFLTTGWLCTLNNVHLGENHRIIRVVVEGLGCLVGFSSDGGSIEPITQSTRVSAGDLDGSLLAWGAWGIRSYKVPD